MAQSQGAVVGFCALLVQGGEAEVEPIVVTAARRSQGIGRLRLREMVAEAGRRGTMRLFHDAGFRVLGRVDMLMDLSPEGGYRRPGITIHGREFEYWSRYAGLPVAGPSGHWLLC